jgi:hypothetical protein
VAASPVDDSLLVRPHNYLPVNEMTTPLTNHYAQQTGKKRLRQYVYLPHSQTATNHRNPTILTPL